MIFLVSLYPNLFYMKTENYSKNSTKCGVYVIKNIINKKVYVGCTKAFFRARKTRHLKMLRDGDHFNCRLQEDYNNFGVDNFIFKIVKICKKEMCDHYEGYYIKKYKSNEPEFGYNIQTVKEYFFKQERSESFILNLKKHKKQKSKQNGFLTTERGINKPISVYKLDGSFFMNFDSLQETCDYFKIGKPYLCNMLKRKYPFRGDYVFFYNYGTVDDSIFKKINDYISSLRKKINVYTLDNKLVLNSVSIQEAASFLNCKDCEVVRCYMGKRKRIRKYYVKKLN